MNIKLIIFLKTYFTCICWLQKHIVCYIILEAVVKSEFEREVTELQEQVIQCSWGPLGDQFCLRCIFQGFVKIQHPTPLWISISPLVGLWSDVVFWCTAILVLLVIFVDFREWNNSGEFFMHDGFDPFISYTEGGPRALVLSKIRLV